MIVGVDISQFQGRPNWDILANNVNFVMMKATEGVGFIDAQFGYNRLNARSHNVAHGFYAFAHPDLGNTPEAEAQFFLDVLNGDPLQEGEVLALDFEVDCSDPVTWCKAWLDYVYQKTGVKALIYMDQSRAGLYDWSPVVNDGYGLWIADYTYGPTIYSTEIGDWPFAAMQQWENDEDVPGISGYVDADEFFGTVEQFKEYGYHAPTPVEQPTQEQAQPAQPATPAEPAQNEQPQQPEEQPVANVQVGEPQAPVEATITTGNTQPAESTTPETQEQPTQTEVVNPEPQVDNTVVNQPQEQQAAVDTATPEASSTHNCQYKNVVDALRTFFHLHLNATLIEDLGKLKDLLSEL